MGYLRIFPDEDESENFTITQPAIVSSAGSLVTSRFATSADYTNDLWVQAESLLTELSNVDFAVDWDEPIMADADDGGLSGINPSNPVAPEIDDITVADVPFPYSPPEAVTNTLPNRDAPEYSVPDPGMSIPEPPTVVWPELSATAPEVSDPAIPSAPTLTLPAVPQLAEITVPSPPEYSIPEFEWELPTADLTAPEPQFSWNEAEYSSAIRTKLADKIYDELVTGGTGLADATEQAIYDRATSRLEQEEQAAVDRTMDFFASRGYIIPPGAIADQILELERKKLQVREDINNDILIQQSKLAQTNTHFIITSAIENEKVLMQYSNEMQSRALDAAKFTVTASVQIYMAKIEKYKAELAAYAAKAEVYKARIQGEIAKAEFYRAQIEGLRAVAEVQKAVVMAYSAQVEAVKLWVDIYAVEMQSAKVQAEVDAVRIQAYATKIQAYSVQVAAATERYKGYQAQIAGELGKAEIFKAYVDAYKSRVSAYSVEVEADSRILQQEISINQNAVDIFKARIQEYSAKVEQSVAEAQAKAQIEGVKVDAYKADTNKYQAELDVLIRAYLGKIEEVKARVDTALKSADIAVREALGKQELIQGNIRAAAQIASQMGSSAMASVSASAHIGYGENRSDGTSQSISDSTSYNRNRSSSSSTITEYIHTYSEE